MRVRVIGQRGNGPVLDRTVTLVEFFEAWGEWGPWLWVHARRETVEVDGHRVRLVVVDDVL